MPCSAVAVQAVYVVWLERLDIRLQRPPCSRPAALPLWITYDRLASCFEASRRGRTRSSALRSTCSPTCRDGGRLQHGWSVGTALVGVAAVVGLVLASSAPAPRRAPAGRARLPARARRCAQAAASGSRAATSSSPSPSSRSSSPLGSSGHRVRGAISSVRARASRSSGSSPVEIAWGWHKPRALRRRARTYTRARTGAWLAATSRSDDVPLGYEPPYLDADGGAPIRGRVLRPRADPRPLLAHWWRREPARTRVWASTRPTSRMRTSAAHHSRPLPGEEYETRASGPFLVIRTKEPVGTPERFIRHTIDVELLGRQLRIGDAGLNLSTAIEALRRLEAG